MGLGDNRFSARGALTEALGVTMKFQLTTVALLVVLAASAGFIWVTTQQLPPIVASHFGASGEANGFMPRTIYAFVMLLLAVGTPLFVAFVPSLLLNGSSNNINIPNREYWLAPARRKDTISSLVRALQYFAIGLALFLSYLHWLVVQANQLHPPALPFATVFYPLALFLVALVVWLVMLFRRFRKPAQSMPPN
jgi:uncharacterized membrane protein